MNTSHPHTSTRLKRRDTGRDDDLDDGRSGKSARGEEIASPRLEELYASLMKHVDENAGRVTAFRYSPSSARVEDSSSSLFSISTRGADDHLTASNDCDDDDEEEEDLFSYVSWDVRIVNQNRIPTSSPSLGEDATNSSPTVPSPPPSPSTSPTLMKNHGEEETELMLPPPSTNIFTTSTTNSREIHHLSKARRERALGLFHEVLGALDLLRAQAFATETSGESCGACWRSFPKGWARARLISITTETLTRRVLDLEARKDEIEEEEEEVIRSQGTREVIGMMSDLSSSEERYAAIKGLGRLRELKEQKRAALRERECFACGREFASGEEMREFLKRCDVEALRMIRQMHLHGVTIT